MITGAISQRVAETADLFDVRLREMEAIIDEKEGNGRLRAIIYGHSVLTAHQILTERRLWRDKGSGSSAVQALPSGTSQARQLRQTTFPRLQCYRLIRYLKTVLLPPFFLPFIIFAFFKREKTTLSSEYSLCEKCDEFQCLAFDNGHYYYHYYFFF